MADAGRKVRVIALTSLQETLRRRVLWALVLLVVIIGVIMAESMSFLTMADESGETGMADSLRANMMATAFDIWTTSAKLLAVFLSAIALSSETTSRTIVTVLSRPIDRTAYLAGRWMGVLAFLWAFQLSGVLLLVGFKAFIGASAAPTLWYGLADTLATVTVMSGAALALSVAVPPIVAGAIAFLLPFLPFMVSDAMGSPSWLARSAAAAVYYLSPSALATDLVSTSFSRELLNPEHGLYTRVIAEHFLYAFVVFALGCVLFGRRELRLR